MPKNCSKTEYEPSKVIVPWQNSKNPAPIKPTAQNRLGRLKSLYGMLETRKKGSPVGIVHPANATRWINKITPWGVHWRRRDIGILDVKIDESLPANYFQHHKQSFELKFKRKGRSGREIKRRNEALRPGFDLGGGCRAAASGLRNVEEVINHSSRCLVVCWQKREPMTIATARLFQPRMGKQKFRPCCQATSLTSGRFWS